MSDAKISRFNEADLHTFEYGQISFIPDAHLFGVCLIYDPYPGQTGTGQKCSNVGKPRPHLNIYAPKPHRRWGPRLYPVPVVSQRVPVSV